MADSTTLRDTGIVIGSVIGFATLVYNVQKEHGISTKRQRQLDLAKARLGIWETRSKIYETILSGQQLDDARAEAKQAIGEIWRQANENLDILADWNLKPLPIVGLPWWKRALLAYRPIHGHKFLGYASRLMYWLCLAATGFLVAAVLWGSLIYVRETPVQRAGDWQWLSKSKDGRKAVAAMALNFFMFGYNAWSFARSIRRERPFRKLEVLDHL